MTQSEFDAWKEETAKSKHLWTVDHVQMSHDRYLFYKGGESGHYIMVDEDGQMTLGTYEGAIPHIGEAEFKVQHSRKYPNNTVALSRLMESGGMPILTALVFGRSV